MIWTFVLNFKFSSLCSVDAHIFCFTLNILPVKFMTFLNQKISLMLRYICNLQMMVLILMKIVTQNWYITFISDDVENVIDLQDEAHLENEKKF